MILKIFAASGFVVCFFTYYQFISRYFNISYPNSLLYSNTHYSQGYMQMLGSFKRISSTFTEPSYAGGCLVSFFTYHIFKAENNLRSLIFIALFLCATILTTSSTAVVGLAFTFLLFILFKCNLRIIFFMLITFVIIMILFPDYLKYTVINKLTSLSYVHRSLSNDISFKILLDSYGLGVGLGSNRPSSFLFYLLSNIGVLGVTAFFSLMFIIGYNYYCRFRSLDNTQMAIFTSFTVYLFCKIVAIPDLNDPFFWMVFCLLCLFRPRVLQKRTIRL